MFDNKIDVLFLYLYVRTNKPLFLKNHLSIQEAEDYAKHFLTHKIIPKESCLQYTHLYYCQHKEFFTYIDDRGSWNKNKNNDNVLSGTFNGVLKFNIVLKNTCKCPAGACFENMANGKCTDKFVREIICTKLFKDKYEQR